MSNVINLEDHRKVWLARIVLYKCCLIEAVAVFHIDSTVLECPQCGKMTTFTISPPNLLLEIQLQANHLVESVISHSYLPDEDDGDYTYPNLHNLLEWANRDQFNIDATDLIHPNPIIRKFAVEYYERLNDS